jgi:hypothetical protein
MSAKHKAFGYRPPPGPLATEVQGATAKHPDSSAGISADMLHEAAREDAARIAYAFCFVPCHRTLTLL